MSLIFAKKVHEGDICIVSDTKLSHDSMYKLPRYSDYQKNGGLKLFIVNNGSVAIAFAGTISIAQDAFDQIKKGGCNLQTTLKHLQVSSLEDSNSTDFLLCDANDGKIYKIASGIITEPKYCYIGDVVGYKLLTKSITQESDLSDLEAAMNIVIRDSSIKTVGGFCVSAVSEGNCFRYTNKLYYSQSKGRIEITNTPKTIPIISNPINDTYSYAWYGNQDGFMFYFYEANLGLIFSPLDISPVEIIPEISFTDFSKRLDGYGLKMPIQIGSTEDEELLIDFSYELYKSAQYQRCIDKICSIGHGIKLPPKIFFQANYLLGCCYKELGIATESESILRAVELLKKSKEHFDKLSFDYEPEYSVLINRGIALNYLGYMTTELERKRECFENSVSDFSSAILLDDKKVIPYQNRAAANYELLRYCTNTDQQKQLIHKIIQDCEYSLVIDKDLQMAASLKMQVLSMLA